MSVDPEFYGAFIDGSDSVEWSDTWMLGFRLRKFSLWHRLLLKSIESPFITGTPVVLWDIETAVAICRTSYGRSRLKRPKFQPFLIKVACAFRALRWRNKELNPIQVETKRLIEEFATYTKDYLQKAEYSVIPPETSGPGRRPPQLRGRPPEELESVGKLVHFGFSKEEAWNMPIGEGRWWMAMADKAAGADLDFTTDSERNFRLKLGPEYRHN